MHNMGEEVFEQVFRAGALRNVSLVMRDSRVSVSYLVNDGSQGFIKTKRGDVKQYRVDTALLFLRRCGLEKVDVDISNPGATDE